MSMDHTTYVFYGVHVPRDQYEGFHIWEESERLDKVINEFGVKYLGHLTAGRYDQDELYLVAGDAREVTPGNPWLMDAYTVSPDTMQALYALAAKAGYGGLGVTGWMVVINEG